MVMTQEEVYSIEEAAKRLKVHKDTVRRMIKNGQIKAHLVGRQYRIRQSEIERLLGGQEQQPHND